MCHVRNSLTKKRTAAFALTTSLLALTLAAPASAGTQPAVTGTISLGSPTNIGGDGPLGVAVDPLRGIVYVCQSNYTQGLGYVQVIDENTNAITATITVGHYPYAIAIDPIHWVVWVTNYLDASVSAIDERTNTVIATLPTGSTPHDITVDPFRGTVYVANDGGRSITVIDEATLTVTNTVTVPNNLNSVGIGVDPVRGLVGVAAFSVGFVSSYLLVLDERTNQFIDTVTVLAAGPTVQERVAVDSIRKAFYLPDIETGTLDVISDPDFVVKAYIPTGSPVASQGPFGVAEDPITGLVYTVNSGAAAVAAIDPQKRVVEATIPIPNAQGLNFIALDPVRGLAYVVANTSNTLTVISTGKGTACKDLQNYPLLPLLCETSLYNSKPGQDRPFWPWADAQNFH